MKKLLFLFVFLCLLGVVFVQIAKGASITPKGETAKQSTKAAEIKTRLTEAKLRSCQARENALKKRLASLTKLVENMLNKFDIIAKRTEDFYTAKLIPAGKTVKNYNDLVADISAKKTAVQKELGNTQSQVMTFSCAADDPKGDLTKFREDMQTVKKALQDYRTAIKNLIVAVRTANGEKVEAEKESAK